MCGIAGIHAVTLDPIDAEARVAAMVDTLRHRGPDGDGVLVEPPVALGHTRLAIIDLSTDAGQPMDDSSGRYVLVYNGEVFNYLELRGELERQGVHFRTESDSEVLLAAFATWGHACLQRLNGMFAFAIYDRVRRALFLARDRLGVKPLVYAWDGARLTFASEHKALVAAGACAGDLDHDTVYEYIARGYASQGRSFFRGVAALPAGHALELLPGGRPRVWRWWAPDTTPDEGRSFEDWAEEVGALLQDAVRLRLRSDVPVGAHLSGGLDSSAVVAAAARLGVGLETFTGAFPHDPSSDERGFARQVTAQYGLVSHEVEIDIAELAASWDRLIWHLDEPIAGPSVFPQLLVCDLAARHGVKVVLGGQGGDELFGGYLRHRLVYHRRAATSGDVRQRIASAGQFVRLALPQVRRVRRTSTRVPDSALDPAFLAAVDPSLRREVRRPRLAASSAGELMLHDLRHYLPALLHLEDRTSMAASIESRTPLLDYRLVELALRVPDAERFRGRDGKPLLRKAVGDWLPPDVARRRDKRGFPTPIDAWRERPPLRSLVASLTTGLTSEERVFSDAYQRRADRMQPSELWTVLWINGWLEQIAHPARGGRPAVAEALGRAPS